MKKIKTAVVLAVIWQGCAVWRHPGQVQAGMLLSDPVILNVESRFGDGRPPQISLISAGDVFVAAESSLRVTGNLVLDADGQITIAVPVEVGGDATFRSADGSVLIADGSLIQAGGEVRIITQQTTIGRDPPDVTTGGVVVVDQGGTTLNAPPQLPDSAALWPHPDAPTATLTDSDPITVVGDVLLRLSGPVDGLTVVTDGRLHLVAIPEPRSMMVLVLGLLAMGSRSVARGLPSRSLDRSMTMC